MDSCPSSSFILPLCRLTSINLWFISLLAQFTLPLTTQCNYSAFGIFADPSVLAITESHTPTHTHSLCFTHHNTCKFSTIWPNIINNSESYHFSLQLFTTNMSVIIDWISAFRETTKAFFSSLCHPPREREHVRVPVASLWMIFSKLELTAFALKLEKHLPKNTKTSSGVFYWKQGPSKISRLHGYQILEAGITSAPFFQPTCEPKGILLQLFPRAVSVFPAFH